MTDKPKKPTTKNTQAPYTFKRGDFVMFDNIEGIEATGIVALASTDSGTPPGIVAIWTGEMESRSDGLHVHVLYELPVDKLKLLLTLDCTTYAGQYHE